MKYDNLITKTLIERGKTEAEAEREFEAIMDAFYPCIDNNDDVGADIVLTSHGLPTYYDFCLI